jgi:hypothetical protein
MKPLMINVAVLAIFLLTGCGLYRVNPPLSRDDLASKRGYRYRNLTETPANNTEKNFVIITMSGGGTRAAALAFGVIKHLSDAKLDRSGTTLLDEELHRGLPGPLWQGQISAGFPEGCPEASDRA